MASPISAQQQSAEESREEFDTRMLNMVSELETEGVFFFAKRVSKSMVTAVVQGPYAYSLEFPHAFLHEHSKKFGIDAIFAMTGSHQIWPIKVKFHLFKHQKAHVFAYGDDGWKDFLMDNHIKVGNFFIFTLIQFLCFKVFIGRAHAKVYTFDNNNANQGFSHKDNAIQGLVPPWFVVTICLPLQPKHPENHFHLEKDLSLVIPLSSWKLQNQEAWMR